MKICWILGFYGIFESLCFYYYALLIKNFLLIVIKK